MAFILTEDAENPGFYLLTDTGGGTGGSVIDETGTIITLPGNRMLMVRKGDGQLITAMQPNAGAGELVLGSDDVSVTLRGAQVSIVEGGLPWGGSGGGGSVAAEDLAAVAFSGDYNDLFNAPAGGGSDEPYEGSPSGYYVRYDSAQATWGNWTTLPTGFTHWWWDSSHDASAPEPPILTGGAWWDTAPGVDPNGGEGGNPSDLELRQALVKGQDRPVRGVNCGVLTDVVRDDIFPSGSGVYMMSAGETLENKTIHGTLKTAADCTVRNVRVLGKDAGTTSTGPILDMTDSGATAFASVLIEDCDFTPLPEYASAYLTHAKGSGGTIRRSILAGLVDGMQVWNGDLRVEQSWIGDLHWVNPDPIRPDGQATHNDGFQFEGGSGAQLVIDGCVVDVYDDSPSWANSRSLFGFLVTQNTGVPQDIILKDSWWRGGSFPINITLVPTGVIEVTGNRIEGGQDPTWPGYHIIAPTTVQNAWTLSGNTAWSVTGTAPNDAWTQTGSSIQIKQG